MKREKVICCYFLFKKTMELLNKNVWFGIYNCGSSLRDENLASTFVPVIMSNFEKIWFNLTNPIPVNPNSAAQFINWKEPKSMEEILIELHRAAIECTDSSIPPFMLSIILLYNNLCLKIKFVMTQMKDFLCFTLLFRLIIFQLLQILMTYRSHRGMKIWKYYLRVYITKCDTN